MRAIIRKNIESLNFIRTATEVAAFLNVKVFIVGGYVRDVILNRKSKDIDFVVVGNGLEFAEELAKRLDVKNISIFKTFGTAQFVYNSTELEFVGARKESYKHNSRNPEVLPGTLEDDINRRDFTINSFAVSINKEDFGNLIDTFDGLHDIKNKIIRTPLNPKITFNDDPLRIMRAVRFASQLGFTINDNLLKAAEELAPRLKIISQERITTEFLKILSSSKPSIGLKYMFHAKILDVIFPELSKLSGVEQRKNFHHKDVFFHTCEVVDNIVGETGNIDLNDKLIWLRFAALVHDIAKPKTKKFVEGTGWTFHGHEELGARMMKYIFKRLKLPLSHLSYVEKLVRLHLRPIALVNEQVTDSAIRRLIVAAGEDLDDLITLCRADITSKNPNKVKKYLNNYERVMQKVFDVREKDQLRAFQSPVRGDEIMKICGLPPSKKIGELKSAIEEAILDGKIGNNYDEAYQYLLKLKDEML